MTKIMEKLSKAQQVVLALFFGLLGVALITIPFYMGGKEMIKPTGVEYEWTTIHYVFESFGIVFVAISLRLSILDKLFSISTGFLGRFFGNNKTTK